MLEVHSGGFDATYWPPHTAPLTRGRLVLSGVDDAEQPVELEAEWGNLEAPPMMPPGPGAGLRSN